MNESEKRSWMIAAGFYDRWRGTIIETDEQWLTFSEDLRQLAADLDSVNSLIGQHLFNAIVDTFNELYQNGMKPVPANYFGRDDF